MKEERYSISEASRILNLENHVLRYWEEQLELDIPRNEQGQRYYKEKEIRILSCIKELKNKGFQLKAVKEILPELENDKSIDAHKLIAEQAELKEEEEDKMPEPDHVPEAALKEGEIREDKVLHFPAHLQNDQDGNSPSLSMPPAQIRQEPDLNLPENSIRNNQEKMQEFEDIMGRIVGKALRQQAGEISDIVADRIQQKVIKEMDDTLDEHMARTEEYFKKLDEAIRIRQRARQEAAVARDDGGKRKSRFFRKNKRKI